MANYLYNGVILPKLPEWDKEKYPYAYIYHKEVSMMLGESYVFFADSVEYGTDDSGNRNMTVRGVRYSLKDTDNEHQYSGDPGYYWELYGEETRTLLSVNVMWANFDILNEDGSVFLAATDPLPVGTPITDPLSFAMGYQLGCRLRAQRAVKPNVFTIEWDGEVTEPNYNEYYCRVTERIFTEEELTGAIAVFGGVEYTTTQLRVNELVVGSGNDASEGFWLETSDSTGGPVVLISGKAGKWYPSKVSTWCFVLPADGTYFVRRWDTDGKYTERVTLPNVK